MKLRVNKILSAILIAIMTLDTVGCGVNETVIEAQSNVKHISFSWWGGDGRHTYTLDGVDSFEQLNKDIVVDCKYGIWNGYSKRQNIYMASNEAPDVMQINYSWLDEYSPDGDAFYDIYELTEYVDLSNFTHEELDYGEVKGSLNAIPIAFNAETIYYNKDLYDKYNLSLPKTWDDLFAAAKIMRKDNIYPIGMADKAAFFFILAYFEQTTGRTACDENGKLTLTREDIAYMLEFYKRLVDEEVIPPVHQYDRNVFSQGQAAATMGWVSDVDRYCSVLMGKGANVVVGDYPKTENCTNLGWYIKPATMYAISKNTKEPVAAAKLLNYLLNSREMALLQKTEKGIPVSDSAYNTLEQEGLLEDLATDANAKITNNQKNLSKMATVLEESNVYLSFINDSDYYLYGKMPLEQVVEIIYNEFYGE